MMGRLFSMRVAPLAALIGFAALLHAQALTRPEVPEAIKAPAGETVLFRAHASGVQIYLCGQTADGKPQWTLKAPEAELRDERGALIGRHFAGPSWRHNDGSEVTGKAVARVESPDPGSIPWLLVSAVTHAGHGVLEHVGSIQRIHTQGGQPPPASTCDPVKEKDKQASRPYSADYYFYAPAEK